MFSATTPQLDIGENDIVEAGDSIAFNVEVSNTGNTCLQILEISDLLVGSAMSCDDVTGGSVAHCIAETALKLQAKKYDRILSLSRSKHQRRNREFFPPDLTHVLGKCLVGIG